MHVFKLTNKFVTKMFLSMLEVFYLLKSQIRQVSCCSSNTSICVKAANPFSTPFKGAANVTVLNP